jgi:amino acid adenylation domain-containing protein
MSQLAQRLAALSPEKLMLLERRIKERNGSVSPSAPSMAELPRLSADEEAQLREWNKTQVEYEHAGVCLHELFALQAERTPERVAVIAGQQQWTYGELDERAEQIAGRLQQLGVGVEERVGICVERSLEMIAAILGVLKAGATYVPLDPVHPAERIKLMLQDAGVRVVLTQSWLRDQLPVEVQLVSLDESWEGNTPFKAVALSPDNLAYVIYTSGSTGVPKGVMISHRAALNHMLWMQSVFSVTEADRVLQKTPFIFDASVWEIFLPLLTGACLILARHGGHTESDYLVQLAAEEKITILQVVPSLLRMLLDEPGLSNCTTLRLLFSGGETLPAELAERFFARLNAGLINFYGPTEATIDATFWTCKRDGGDSVPIGHPLANMQIHVLDARQQLVPVGVTGELYIGGIGLSRGYLNRADLTAKSFVPDPFSAEPGQRLFRTGDLVRRRSDGAIEFLGRADHQVKLRGLRIELDEIEATLEKHPAVRHAAVMLREFTPGDQRLVGYVLPKNGTPPTSKDLRTFLSEKLPATMVPSLFVLLETFPLLPNGKLDRQALPLPDTRDLETDYVAPGDALEETLATIWAEVLGVKRIGIHDNFFEVGGHSLLATRIVSRVREVLRIEVPLRSLFQTPTIAKMAEVARGLTPTVGELSAPSVSKIQPETDAELAERVARLSDEEVDQLLRRMLASEEVVVKDFNGVRVPPHRESKQEVSGKVPPPSAPAASSVMPVNGQMQHFEEAYVNYIRGTQEAWADAQRRSMEAYVAYLKTLQHIWTNVDVTKLDPQTLMAISQHMALAAASTANVQGLMSWQQNNGFW